MYLDSENNSNCFNAVFLSAQMNRWMIFVHSFSNML
jgi:hypothetical protein